MLFWRVSRKLWLFSRVVTMLYSLKSCKLWLFHQVVTMSLSYYIDWKATSCDSLTMLLPCRILKSFNTYFIWCPFDHNSWSIPTYVNSDLVVLTKANLEHDASNDVNFVTKFLHLLLKQCGINGTFLKIISYLFYSYKLMKWMIEERTVRSGASLSYIKLKLHVV